MQVALIDALVTPMAPMLVLTPDLVSDGGGGSCMLLLHPTKTCTDAGPVKIMVFRHNYACNQ